MELNLCFHTEAIAERKTYESLARFVRGFVEITRVIPIVCVMTPRCPVIARQIDLESTSAEVYAERLRTLSESCAIGYHGHFFEPESDSRGTAGRIEMHRFDGAGVTSLMRPDLFPINAANPRPDLIAKQFALEFQWLCELELRPNWYAAGWWYLPAEVIDQLKHFEFRVDTSIKLFDARDTFGVAHRTWTNLHASKGSRYLGDGEIREIPSIAGLRSRRVRTAEYLLRARLKGVRRGVFYLHDYELPGTVDETLSAIAWLTRLPWIRWFDPRGVHE